MSVCMLLCGPRASDKVAQKDFINSFTKPAKHDARKVVIKIFKKQPPFWPKHFLKVVEGILKKPGFGLHLET